MGILELEATVAMGTTFELGSTTLETVRVKLTPFKPNEFWSDGNKKRKFDGLLGFPEIKKIGERIKFIVKNDRVDHIIIDDFPPDANTAYDETDISSKIFLSRNKPYINLTIEGQSYACLWDTGWDVTTISDSIYKKHADVIPRTDFDYSANRF